MKKLMLAAALVCAVATSQAAQVKWTGTIGALDAASVVDNGTYNIGSAGLAGNGALTYAITFFLAGEQVASDSGTMTITALSKGGTVFDTTATAALQKSTAYTYELVLSGTQTDLAARGVDGAYDYSAATIETTLTGSFTTKANGQTTFNDANVASWTVSGIQSVPEPTSGFLLLLGMAGLALRRRRA